MPGWFEPRRRCDGSWALWQRMSDLELGIVTTEELGAIPVGYRWVIVATAAKKSELPDMRKHAD